MRLLDLFSRGKPPAPAVGARAPGPSAAYMSGGGGPFFPGWTPALRDQSQDVQAGFRAAAARTVDAIQNSGWLANIVNRSVVAAIGTGLKLAAKPDYEALGWSKSDADQWSRAVERRFEAWAGSAAEVHIEAQANLHQLADASYRGYFRTGEIVLRHHLASRPFASTSTKLQILPSHRMPLENLPPAMRSGVRFAADGLRVGYRLRLFDGLSDRDYDIPARDAYGRPVLVHIYDYEAGSVRGITPFAPALRVVRQYDQLSDATLIAALIQAIFAATVTSAAPTSEIMGALASEAEQSSASELDHVMTSLAGMRADWYSHANLDLGRHGKIAHLMPGDELKFLTSQHPNTTYEAFADGLLREIAACAGVTFEEATGKYAGATYASINMATVISWATVLLRRSRLIAPIYQTAYEAWIEEDIERGLTPFPGGIDGFLAARAAVCRAAWTGPKRPQGDALKEAKALRELRDMGVMSDEQICAELGTDWEDVYEARARERARRAELGLPEPAATTAVADDPLDPDPPAGGPRR